MPRRNAEVSEKRCRGPVPTGKGCREPIPPPLESFLEGQVGRPRWMSLKPSLLKPHRASILINSYSTSAPSLSDITHYHNKIYYNDTSYTNTDNIEVSQKVPSDKSDKCDVRQVKFLSIGCYEFRHDNDCPDYIALFDQPAIYLNNIFNYDTSIHPSLHASLHPSVHSSLMPYYCLDAGSVLVSECLGITPGHSVLDMCAAPGGKSVAIGLLLKLHTCGESRMVSNEPQGGRYTRLCRVMHQYIPCEYFLNRQVCITSFDASSSSFNKYHSNLIGVFDRVLVDGPCLSDRHVFNDTTTTSVHHTSSAASPSITSGGLSIYPTTQSVVKKSKANAHKQILILSNGVEALKPGGRVMYATCTVSAYENDMVVLEVLKKKNYLNLVVLPIGCTDSHKQHIHTHTHTHTDKHTESDTHTHTHT
eukprot:GHVR01028099.1.p1 GENE.GHVR01028099.1~~GHVR01028099.1.p1  ORF type:complete len:419 (-),score=124.54 GHVR01028099.1:49-1305(-)